MLMPERVSRLMKIANAVRAQTLLQGISSDRNVGKRYKRVRL
jgi:hypothetical protein